MLTCACGRKKVAHAKRCRWCRWKASQRTYSRTAKGKATQQRYLRTAKGKAKQARQHKKRLYVGAQYVGCAATAQQAAQINTHIKERVREFKQRFTNGEKAQGAAPGEVSAEAAV